MIDVIFYFSGLSINFQGPKVGSSNPVQYSVAFLHSYSGWLYGIILAVCMKACTCAIDQYIKGTDKESATVKLLLLVTYWFIGTLM